MASNDALKKLAKIVRKRREGKIAPVILSPGGVPTRVTSLLVALCSSIERSQGHGRNDVATAQDLVATLNDKLLGQAQMVVGALVQDGNKVLQHFLSTLGELSDLAAIFPRDSPHRGKICAAIRELSAAGDNFLDAKLDGRIVPRFDEEKKHGGDSAKNAGRGA